MSQSITSSILPGFVKIEERNRCPRTLTFAGNPGLIGAERVFRDFYSQLFFHNSMTCLCSHRTLTQGMEGRLFDNEKIRHGPESKEGVQWVSVGASRRTDPDGNWSL